MTIQEGSDPFDRTRAAMVKPLTILADGHSITKDPSDRSRTSRLTKEGFQPGLDGLGFSIRSGTTVWPRVRVWDDVTKVGMSDGAPFPLFRPLERDHQCWGEVEDMRPVDMMRRAFAV